MGVVGGCGQIKPLPFCYAYYYRQGRYYQVEGVSPVTGKPHSPLTIRAQLEKVMEMAGGMYIGEKEESGSCYNLSLILLL